MNQSDNERIAALEARVSANEKSSDRAMMLAERAADRAETAITKRFEAGNEIRGAMQDQARNFVTRAEFQWALGTVILVLIGMLVRMLTSAP